MKVFKVTVIFLFILLNSVFVFANSAGPPAIIIICDENVDGLEVYFIVDDQKIHADEYYRGQETYYVLTEYEHFTYPAKISTVCFESNEKSFEISLDDKIKKYDNVFTLNFFEEELIEGKELSRNIQMISYRLISTLIIEGIILLFFSFNLKKVWKVFLGMNLLTQSFLNFFLIQTSPITTEFFIVFYLMAMEIIILIVELIIFNKYAEGRTLKKSLYVLTANALSLYIGIISIPMIPV